MRAILFHHVGGDHYALRSLLEQLSPEIETFTYELPGRADRIREPLLRSADAVLDDVFEQTRAWRSEPYALIGMSLGGLLAYALCNRLREHAQPLPGHLFIASRKFPENDANLTPVSALPEEAFWDYVLQYGGCPPELPKHRELREFYGPILRADFSAGEDLVRRLPDIAPLDIPTGIYYGIDDRPDFKAPDASDWAPRFVPTPEYRQFPGGHFFLYERTEAARHIKQILLHGG